MPHRGSRCTTPCPGCLTGPLASCPPTTPIHFQSILERDRHPQSPGRLLHHHLSHPGLASLAGLPLPPGHPLFSAGSCPALPHLLDSGPRWSGTHCSPTPSVGRMGATSVLCVFLGPRSVDSRGTRRRAGVGSSVPLRHRSARLLWWVPLAWSRALDPREEDRLKSGSPLHSSGPLPVFVRHVLHLGALPLPALGLPRSSCECVCRGDLLDAGLELCVRKDCRGSGVDETWWWRIEGSTSQGSRVRRAGGVQAERESAPFLSSSQFVLLPIAGCLCQAGRQTCRPAWQTLGPALHPSLLLQTGTWARGPDPMWPVN